MRKIKNTFPRAVILLLAFACLAADKPKLVKMKVNDEITVSVPQGWKAMDGMDFTERYPSVRAPLGAFTNDERSVDFSINISATQWPDSDLPLAQKFFKASLMNMLDKVEIIGEGISEIKGKKFIYFEFTSRVNGNRVKEGLAEPILKYSYIQYLLGPQRTLVFSFNCQKRQQQDWQETAREMMKSVRVK